MEKNNAEFKTDTEYFEFLKIARELESELYMITHRPNTKELLEIFPEGKEVINTQIAEWQAKRNALVKNIKLVLIKIHLIKDEFSQWFWKKWLKESEGEKLLEIDGHINRLKNYLYVARGQPPGKNAVTDAMIQQAKSVLIENITNRKLRKLGNKLTGLCPFHNEKHPSFFIYTKTNSFHCFGCQKGGDVISFTMLLNDLNFIETVKLLTNK